MAMFKFMRNRRYPDNDDDSSAPEDPPMPRSNGASNHRPGGGGHQKQRRAQGRQGSRSPSIDRSTSNQPILRRTNSGAGVKVGVDKAYHRGGNRSFLSDTCSESDGSPDSGSGEWGEDGSGDAGKASSSPPPPPPPSRRRDGGAPSRANIAGADSVIGGFNRGTGGGEFMDRNDPGRGIARSNSHDDVEPFPQSAPKDHPVARGSARVLPPPPSLIKDADIGDDGDEKSIKIKPPSIRGMPRTRKSKSLTRSDPTLISSSPSSSKSWGPDGVEDGVRVAAAPIAEGEAMQRLAQLVVSLRADLRKANAAREELKARLLLKGESRKSQAMTLNNDDDDNTRLRLQEENSILRADVDALFAEQDDLKGEIAELREEKMMLNDVIARLKRESGGGGDASLGGASRSSIVSYKKTTTSSVQDLEDRIADLTDENHKLESELQLLVGEKSELINSRSLEAAELRKSLMEQESRNSEISAQKDRTIKEMHEKIDLLLEERDGLKKILEESKMTVAVLEDELKRQNEEFEENEAKSKKEFELLQVKLAQAEKDVKMMQERSSVADRILLEQKKTVEELLKERHVRQELDDIKVYDMAGNPTNLEKEDVSQDKSRRANNEDLNSKNVTDRETTLQSKRDQQDVIASLQQRTVDLEAELTEANSAISMLEDDLDRKDAQVKELLNKLTTLHQNLSSAEQSNAALSRKNQELISKNDDFETSIKIMTIENKAAKEEIEMWTSMKTIEDDDSMKNNLQQEVEQLRQQLEELRNKSSYKKVMALEEEVYHLQEDKKKILQDLDESSDAIVTLGDALKDLEETLAAKDSEIVKFKGSLDEKETSVKTIMSALKEHQHESQSSADTIATLKMKIASLETRSRDLEKELNINTQAFLELKDEKNDEAAVVTDLQNKLIRATEENGSLTERISLLITANEKMKEEVKKLGESLATCPEHLASIVAAKAALTQPSSSATFPLCAVSSDHMMSSCEALISELRNKIQEIVLSRNAALREVAFLRSDTSDSTLEAIKYPSGLSTDSPTVEQIKSSSVNTNTSSTTSNGPSQQVRASVIRELHESISSNDDDDERSNKSGEKTTAYSRSPSNSGSRGSSLLEAAKKLCSKLEEKKSKEETNKVINRTISVSASSEAPKEAASKAGAPSTEEQLKHILEQDDEVISAKEIKEDSPAETTDMSGAEARPTSPPFEQDAKKMPKPKIDDIDQLTSIFFEKSKNGMSASKFSDVSWSSNSSRPMYPNDSIVKKVKICRNGVFMGTYEGELNAEGQRHGIGVLLCDNGNSYEGEWKKDKRDGLGVARYSSGDVYDGQWERGRRQGHGIMYIDAGDTYIGQWKNGLKHGAGTYHWVDGEVDVSWYQEDKRVGEGVRWTANRKKAFRLVRGSKKEELSLDEAYATAERLGLSLEKFQS